MLIAYLTVLVATTDAATRPLTKAQRACLLKSIGRKATIAYAAGKPVPLGLKAKIRRCLAKPVPKPPPNPPLPTPTPTAPCVPALDPGDVYGSEGPPNAVDAAANLKSTGTVRAIVLFVDFSDAPGTEAPDSIVSNWMAPGVEWLRTTSYGRVSIVLNPVLRWIRMPRPADSYGYARGFTYELHRRYIADAIAAADPTVDFSQTDAVYVVAPRTPLISFSPTFRGAPGVFAADGRNLGPAVTFGLDAYTYGKTVLPHETSHMFGLPDLYLYSGSHAAVGTWDFMGNIFQPTDLFAWHRLKLGWLDAGQLTCAEAGKVTDETLTPLGATGGKKAVFVRTGPRTGLLVENRQPVGNDVAICDAGALVYTVDSGIATGLGPINVVGGDVSGNGCGHGNRSDAPLHVGESVVVAGVNIAVVAGSGTLIAVRVTVSY